MDTKHGLGATGERKTCFFKTNAEVMEQFCKGVFERSLVNIFVSFKPVSSVVCGQLLQKLKGLVGKPGGGFRDQ